MRLLLFVFLFILPAPTVYSQLSKPGVPPGIQQDTLPGDVLYEQLPPVDTAGLLEEDLVTDAVGSMPWRFGKNIVVDLHPDNAGRWHTLSDGRRVWRLGIASPGAYSLNLTFDDYHLPPGAELYVFTPCHEYVLGAFTHLNNQDDGWFATTLVPGDSLVVEYTESHDVAFPGRLNLHTVTHGYRDALDYTKAFGQSGWCNINVACDEGLGWDDQIRSVVMLLTGSNAFCSGVLINNTSNDARPFLLSASHCYRNPSAVVAWFNWQSETCEDPLIPPPYDALSGAQQRARNNLSDFWLLELNHEVPESYNPYFAGWNRTMQEAIDDIVVGIHHPRGDIKKISYSLSGVQASSYTGFAGSGTTHWRIRWDGGTTTEIGSSGSPIFDSQGRILGQLHGGQAACGNTLPDWYGRFGTSWTGNGTEENSLQYWLDPAGLDVEAIGGLDPFGEPVTGVSQFTAASEGEHEIQLSWTPNEAGDMVMIAQSDKDRFGSPRGYYSLGDSIPGGGKVIYMGYDTGTRIERLDHGASQYFSAWSYTPQPRYSKGVRANATTDCPDRMYLPYTEQLLTIHFPPCWSQNLLAGETMWRVIHHDEKPGPYQAISGDYILYFGSPLQVAEQTAQLKSPPISPNPFDQAVLKFHYAIPGNNERQNVLSVLFRGSPGEEWTVLKTFSGETSSWEKEIIDLPRTTEPFQVAFKGEYNSGDGIFLDDIVIDGQYDGAFPAPSDLSAEAGPDHVELSWNYTTGNKQTPIPAGFVVYRDGVPAKHVGDPEKRTHTDAGLPVGTYTYTVKTLYESPDWTSDHSEPATAIIEAGTTTHMLTTDTIGPGLITPIPGAYTYNPYAEPLLMATPEYNATFVEWRVDGVPYSTAASLLLAMDKDKQVEAVFERDQYTLSLASVPPGTAEQTGGGTYGHGSMVQVSTTKSGDRDFLFWSEENIVVSTWPVFHYTITGNKTLSANFSRHIYMITAVTDPVMAGVVYGGGSYFDGDEVMLEAIPGSEHVFLHWTEDDEVVHQGTVYTFIADRSRSLKAHFELKEYQVTVSGFPAKAGTTSPEAGTYSFRSGNRVTLQAYPNNGWHVDHWKINNEVIPGSEAEVHMMEDVTATAMFSRDELVVFPNPAHQFLYVEWPIDESMNKVGLYCMNGRMVREAMTIGEEGVFRQAIISLQGLSQGMYLLRTSTATGTRHHKVLVY